jgi:hypothetical protein
MTGMGCIWENSLVESLFSKLKHMLGLESDAEIWISAQQLQRALAFNIVEQFKREWQQSTLCRPSQID